MAHKPKRPRTRKPRKPRKPRTVKLGGYQPQVLAIAGAAARDDRPGEFSWTPEVRAVRKLAERGLMTVTPGERTGSRAPYATRVFGRLTAAGRAEYKKRGMG